MNWILLVIAGFSEVCFAACLGKAKQTSGFDSIIWYTGFVVFLCLSMYLLIRSVQTIPIGTAYAVWTGIGAVGTATIGIIYFKEPLEFWRLFFIATLVFSLVGLKIVS